MTSASDREQSSRRKVLIFHGYLLRGTGSNIYNANLAPALARLGHEVHLVCQDRQVRPPGVRVHNPDIGGLLPVYVEDPYEGFEVKAFEELTEAELDRYLTANIEAVRAVAAEAGGIDLALASHLVMGPAILACADVAPFAAKIHGSALEYTVKRHPRFLPHAREGMEAAVAVLVGSRHTAESLWAALPEVDGLREKTRLSPPGVDTQLFRPDVPPAGADTAPPPAGGVAAGVPHRGGRGASEQMGEAAATGPAGRSATEPAGRSSTGPARRGDLVVFVGKLIVSKGVDLLLAAWPLVHAAHPDARLQIAGFGEFEGGLRRLLAALEAGDLAEAREVARLGRALEGGEEAPLPILSGFLAEPPPRYAEAARSAAGSVELIGRLEHDEVADLLPTAQALVMPSTFPEAFGMVAAEAAACGALPISADHSGMREVSRRLAEDLPPDVAALLGFPVEAGAVEAIASRLSAWLAMPEGARAAARGSLANTVRRLWSWESVAASVLAGARGELHRLPLA